MSPMFNGHTVALIIPALDEQETIAAVLEAVNTGIVDLRIVADNGSTDATAQRARDAGAIVVDEPRRGYGQACLSGIARARREGASLFVFIDGDGSDDPTEIESLLQHLFDAELEMVIGSRVLGAAEPGALTPVQRFGNALTCALVRWFWRVSYTDLGPFRAIRGAALDRLQMNDRDFGWTIEMQVKAAQRGLRVGELPVSYRCRRGGQSKVSGTLRGSVMAGQKILGTVFRAKLNEII